MVSYSGILHNIDDIYPKQPVESSQNWIGMWFVFKSDDRSDNRRARFAFQTQFGYLELATRPFYRDPQGADPMHPGSGILKDPYGSLGIRGRILRDPWMDP